MSTIFLNLFISFNSDSWSEIALMALFKPETHANC